MINGNPSRLELEKPEYLPPTEGPFHAASNIYMFYGGGERSAIVDQITARLMRSSEPVVVLGEEGSGKSMMSLVLADRLQENYNIVRCEQDRLDTITLLKQLHLELTSETTAHPSAVIARTGIAPENDSPNIEQDIPASDTDESNDICDDQQSLFSSISTSILNGATNKKPLLLIVDAGSLTQDCYDTIEHLTRIENRFGNIFKTVIFQTWQDLSKGVGRHASTQDADKPLYLKQQEPIVLRRLNLAEISEYLQHHMLLFDYNKRDMFTRDMAYFIADRSDGVFKSINLLARNAFILASLEGAQQMSMSHLLMAGLPPPSEKKQVWYRRSRDARKWGVAAIAGAIVLSIVVTIQILT